MVQFTSLVYYRLVLLNWMPVINACVGSFTHRFMNECIVHTVCVCVLRPVNIDVCCICVRAPPKVTLTTLAAKNLSAPTCSWQEVLCWLDHVLVSLHVTHSQSQQLISTQVGSTKQDLHTRNCCTRQTLICSQTFTNGTARGNYYVIWKLYCF